MTMHNRLIGGYTPLERKSGDGAPQTTEFKALSDELMRTVATFREKNDAALEDLKKKVNGGDIILKEHVDRINSAIDDVQKKMEAEILEVKRQAIFSKTGDEKKNDPVTEEYKSVFDRYLRGGFGNNDKPVELMAAEKKYLEAKALATNSETDGGFTVIPQFEQTMIELSLLISPVRGIVDQQTIGTGSLVQPVNKRGTSAGWVGETDPRTQTSTSNFERIEFVPGELYAQPAVTQQMLDDSFLNVEQFLANEASIKMAQIEAQAFISGDGVKKPKGFLAYPVVADASWSWGNVGYIATGASGAFNSTAAGPPIVQGADVFFDLIAALRYPYRPGARFAANRRTVAQMRKLKTLYADYLWVPGLQNGQPDSFAGYPLTEMEDMPDIAANSYAIGYGDFKQFYKIVDRMGVRVLRDPYTAKPYVLFYTTKRVGGGIQNFEAAKFLKFSAS